MRVLGIGGSLRRGSHNTALLRHAGELFESEGAEFAIYDTWREIPVYDDDLDVESPDAAVARIRTAVHEADAVFIATPEYDSSVAGGAQECRGLALASLARQERAAKQAGRRRRGEHRRLRRHLGQAELRKVLGSAGARVVDGEVALGHAMDRFDQNGRLNDENLEDQVREVVQTFLNEVKGGVPARLVA